MATARRKYTKGAVYENVQLKVMRNLCCDVLLEQEDFQRQHRRVVFTYGGTRPELVISSLPPETCAVTAATIECLSLFHDLTPSHLVAVPSCR